MPVRKFPLRFDNTKAWVVYGITIDSCLVYVGSTGNPRARINQHRTSSFPNMDARMFIIEEHDDRPSALAREKLLIEVLKPKFNSQYEGGPQEEMPKKTPTRDVFWAGFNAAQDGKPLPEFPHPEYARAWHSYHRGGVVELP